MYKCLTLIKKMNEKVMNSIVIFICIKDEKVMTD